MMAARSAAPSRWWRCGSAPDPIPNQPNTDCSAKKVAQAPAVTTVMVPGQRALNQSSADTLDAATADGVALMRIDAAMQGEAGRAVWEAGLDTFTAQT